MLSNLTAEQRNSLQAMPQVLGLAADIAHAAVTIYLPGENKKFFNVYKQEQPMTQVGNVRHVNAGFDPNYAYAWPTCTCG